jgi:hypothetical protein
MIHLSITGQMNGKGIDNLNHNVNLLHKERR